MHLWVPHVTTCDNYILVIASGTLGMVPATSLGLVSKGGERVYKNAMRVC